MCCASKAIYLISFIWFPGENFIAIVTTDVMTTMADTARDLLMSHTGAQWLYVISDTNKQKGNLSSLINALHEGENVAYIYNITDNDSSCQVPATCLLNSTYSFCRQNFFVFNLRTSIKMNGYLHRPMLILKIFYRMIGTT